MNKIAYIKFLRQPPKKYQDGGYLEWLPLVGSYYAGKRFLNNPNWVNGIDLGLNLMGDFLTGGSAKLAIKPGMKILRAASKMGGIKGHDVVRAAESVIPGATVSATSNQFRYNESQERKKRNLQNK